MTVVHDDDAPGWIRAACFCIESNAPKLASVDDVASAVGVAPEDLLRGFRSDLGFTPAGLLDDIATTPPPDRHRSCSDVRGWWVRSG